MIIFYTKRHVILCQHSCKAKIKQAAVRTTLVWLNGLRTNSQIKIQKQHDMLSTWREVTPTSLKLWKSIWFHLPYDNSQRLSKQNASLTWKYSIQCINAKLSHDNHQESKMCRPHLRIIITEPTRIQSKLNPDSDWYTQRQRLTYVPCNDPSQYWQ